MSITNIAGYLFTELVDLPSYQEKVYQFCESRAIKGTIILSPEGININLAGAAGQIADFTDFITHIDVFSDLTFKVSYSNTVPFQRLRIKIKRELCPVGQPGIVAGYQPKYVSPETLREWLTEKNVTIIDTRNEFEYDMGTFEGAVNLHMANFSDFPGAIQSLDESLKEQPVVIMCTGGIRCEKAAPVMEQQGFKEVYQLHGGILDYFAACGNAHYRGACFVFDERVALDSQLHPQSER